MLTPDQLKFRNTLNKIKEKGEDNFEKNITYISAGALGLSLTFIDKIVNIHNASNYYLLIFAWALLIITLLGNLVSHLLSAYYHDKSIEDYDNDIKNNTDLFDDKAKPRNKIIRSMNIITVITLIMGIILLVIFLSLNLSK